VWVAVTVVLLALMLTPIVLAVLELALGRP
jgi:hypothetical protein